MTPLYTHGERTPLCRLPPPNLPAFAAHPFGVVVPTGAARHWEAIALWQFRGFAKVEVTSHTSGAAGLVTITRDGKLAATKDITQ